MMTTGTRRLVAAGAIIAPILHSTSDLLELVGGYSPAQLWINYLAFLAIPFVMIGLHAVQRPHAGAGSLLGALAYGSAFTYFAGTTTYALVRGTPDYATLLHELGPAYTVHGAVMIVGGIAFGWGVIRAGVIPRWTGILLGVGVITNLVVALGALPPLGHVAGTLIRNVALVGMGAAVLRGARARKGGVADAPTG